MNNSKKLANEIDILLSKKLSVDDEFLPEYLLKYVKSHIDDIFEEDLQKIYYSIARFASLYSSDESDILLLEKKLLEIAEEEQVSILDIKKVADGGYSRILKLNDKIIKVCNKRACEHIVDNSRILVPIFLGKVGNLIVEVTDYCETKRISIEELYRIYEELRNQGVMWFDPFSKNIGVINDALIKRQLERRKNIKELGIIPNEKSFGLNLKDGDYVIIDLDHMVFDTDVEGIERLRNLLNEETEQRLDYFERRYNVAIKKQK